MLFQKVWLIEMLDVIDELMGVLGVAFSETLPTMSGVLQDLPLSKRELWGYCQLSMKESHSKVETELHSACEFSVRTDVINWEPGLEMQLSE